MELSTNLLLESIHAKERSEDKKREKSPGGGLCVDVRGAQPWQCPAQARAVSHGLTAMGTSKMCGQNR